MDARCNCLWTLRLTGLETLHVGDSSQRFRVPSLLCFCGVSLIVVCSQDGSTPLARAVSRGRASVVAVLLEHDAVISPADVTAAVDNDHADIADVLLTHVRGM